MNAVDQVRLDRSVLEAGSLDDEDTDRAYWQTKPPHDCMEVLELLRQIVYGYDPATTRLQRVLEVAELGIVYRSRTRGLAELLLKVWSRE